jgi:hypothetical protein
MFTTLQNLEHTIQTAYGDSEWSYGGDLWVVLIPGLAWGNKNEGPMSRLGQGNGAAPTGWVVISMLVLEVMQKEGCYMAFKALLSDDEIKFVGFAFVNDMDLLQTGTLMADIFEDVAQYMQDGLDLWEVLLKQQRGPLVPDKSYWYLLDFKWKRGE